MTTTFEEQLDKKGILAYRTKGISMLPLLRQNRDLVVIEKTADYAPDDVVLFKRDNGAYVLHRIISGSPEQGWIICGDNLTQMEPVRHDQLLGKMTAFVKDGKQIPVDDPAYLRYVRSLPRRRKMLPLRRKAARVRYLAALLFRHPGQFMAKLIKRLRGTKPDGSAA